jgi:hypothetical protein
MQSNPPSIMRRVELGEVVELGLRLWQPEESSASLSAGAPGRAAHRRALLQLVHDGPGTGLRTLANDVGAGRGAEVEVAVDRQLSRLLRLQTHMSDESAVRCEVKFGSFLVEAKGEEIFLRSP